MWRPEFQTRRSAPTSAFPRSAVPTSAPEECRLPEVAETGYPRANEMLHRGYIESWNLVFERKLPAQMVATLGYIGLPIDPRLRVPRHQRVADSRLRQRRTAALCEVRTDIRDREWDGRTHSNYHSLQATLNRRFTQGLLIKSAYTFSKAIDEANYSDWTEFRWNASSVRYRNRALAALRCATQLPAGASCTSCRSGAGKKWATDRHERRHLRRLAVERFVCRLFGTAVPADVVGLVAEHAGQPADTGSGEGQRRDLRQGW